MGHKAVRSQLLEVAAVRLWVVVVHGKPLVTTLKVITTQEVAAQVLEHNSTLITMPVTISIRVTPSSHCVSSVSLAC